MPLLNRYFLSATLLSLVTTGAIAMPANTSPVATSLTGDWHMDGVDASPAGTYVVAPAGTQLRITLPSDLKLPQGRDVLLNKISDTQYRSASDQDPVIELTAESTAKAELSIKGRTAYLVVPLARNVEGGR